MWEPPTPAASSTTTLHRPIPLPLSVAQDKDWLLIRTKMPVCIWPDTCLLGCALGDTGGNKSVVQSPIGGLMYNNEYQPPPAHMGIPPVVLDPKTGLPRHPMYAYPAPGQFPPSLYSPDFPPVQWPRTPAGYPISSGAFSGPFPPSLVNSHLSRFGPPGLFPHQGLPHPGMSHPAIVSPGPKQECGMSQHGQDRTGHEGSSNSQSSQPEPERKKPHIKKPLNAFMLFMKEKRQQVVSECTLKESAAINQILGRKWHMLDREEQSKYYDMARKEKERHRQLYPGWSARDNYANQTKKKRKKKENKTEENKDSPSAKKCRAVFGLDKQENWCKPCQSLCEQYCNKFTGLKVEQTEEEKEVYTTLH